MQRFIFTLATIFPAFFGELNAQTKTFNGWLAISHKQSLSKKWAFLADVQARSSDGLRQLETILLRPALQFEFSKATSVAAGYAYLGTWEEHEQTKAFNHEHRAWEQYNLETKAGRWQIVHRLRLEQRFLQKDEDFLFAQRFRYYLRTMLPFSPSKEFTKGAFGVFQNEVFLNIQNKQNVNKRFFDQNRAYAAAGFRWNKMIDTEIGYMYRYQIDDGRKHNHILQLQLNTTF